jgi:hypothetical protein
VLLREMGEYCRLSSLNLNIGDSPMFRHANGSFGAAVYKIWHRASLPKMAH